VDEVTALKWADEVRGEGDCKMRLPAGND